MRHIIELKNITAQHLIFFFFFFIKVDLFFKLATLGVKLKSFSGDQTYQI